MLTKLLILTLHYQIIGCLVVIYMFTRGIKLSSSFSWLSLNINISMFLMQEHNSKQYEKFLHIVRNYICCCCCWKSSGENNIPNNTRQQTCNDTVNETNDIPCEHTKIANYMSNVSAL